LLKRLNQPQEERSLFTINFLKKEEVNIPKIGKEIGRNLQYQNFNLILN
jgi:hypothetical protein